RREMDLLTFDFGAGSGMRAANGGCRFLCAHDSGDSEQAQSSDRAGPTVRASERGDRFAGGEEAAGDPKHMTAATGVRLDVDVPTLCAQKGEIADGGFAAGQNDDVGIGRNGFTRSDE